MEYKCYALSKKTGSVYGIITEDNTGVGYYQMQNYQGKLIPIEKRPNWERKGIFNMIDYDFTTNYQEAFNHMMYHHEKREALKKIQ